MELILELPAKNCEIINKNGTIVLCTLWTPVDYVQRRLQESRPDLLTTASELALIGGLYGGGLNVMLRHLHRNPQLETIVLVGKDFSGTSEHLKLFLAGRISLTGERQTYVFADGHAEDLEKMLIEGTDSAYVSDSLLLPEMLLTRPEIIDLSGPVTEETLTRLEEVCRHRAPKKPPMRRPELVELPQPQVTTFPSDRFSHALGGPTIALAWKELLATLARFGRKVRFRNGKERLELFNVKTVVDAPGDLSDDEIKLLNVSPRQLQDYRRQLLSPDLEQGLSYTYGHRMRKHFGGDHLAWAANDLAKASDGRHAYIALWDNQRDQTGHDAPCLVSVFFRKIDGQVHLSVVFRSHNGGRAWPVNCAGLFGLLETVCRLANESPERTEEDDLTPGKLIVNSLSLSLDPADLPQISPLLEERLQRPYKLVPDPFGFFRITVDRESQSIVVHHHSPEGELLEHFSGQTPSELGRLLTKSKSVSDLSHAMYLGGQLERAYRCLRGGLEYSQDNSSLD
ncbi:MAG: hypothetical protein LBJ64_12670 [Deltaproteobacteria bacterium]|jgi:thymidylate synthase|nr:hypothetical protein [Deltaproteobacteria bacterium]